jgi:hypothetical protein
MINKVFIGLFVLVVAIITGMFWWLKNPKIILITWEGANYLESRSKQYCKKIDPRKKQQSIDINNNGTKEKLYLAKNKFYIKDQEKIIWSSNDDFKIDNFVAGDINNDDELEIVLTLWKGGKYGQDFPFWLEENITDYGHHIFVYAWQEDSLSLIWGSSTLDAPIKELAVRDVNQDSKNELIVLEGNYENSYSSFAEYITIWHWQEWNFFNDFRSKKGKYFGLGIQNIKQNKYICARTK